MTSKDERDLYLLGHADDELTRLERQADLFADATRDSLVRAGLQPGMRVLDLGCGAGDVTLAAARIVGPSGWVQGVDMSEDAVRAANRRLAAAGLAHAECGPGDVFSTPATSYQAIVGRFLLMHLPDPAALLSRLRRDASPGVVIAFLEMDISSASIVPPVPLFVDAVRAICEVYRKAGAEPDMGSRLYAAYRRAGLAPSLHGSCRVVGGNDASAFDYLAGSVCSLAPAMRRAGVLADTIDPATLRDDLVSAAAASDHCVSFPRLICAWAAVRVA